MHGVRLRLPKMRTHVLTCTLKQGNGCYVLITTHQCTYNYGGTRVVIATVVHFGKSVENSQAVAMPIIPHIIGEPFPTYWETSPLVGNYFPSAGTTNLY